MKIGKVYANTTLEENRGDRDIIAMGVIAGDGLLGTVAEAVVELARASEDSGYHHSGWPHLKAEKREEQAWLAVFAALKAIEEAP